MPPIPHPILLVDPGFASRSFSAVLDLLSVALADRHCKFEAGNQPLKQVLEQHPPQG